MPPPPLDAACPLLPEFRVDHRCTKCDVILHWPHFVSRRNDASAERPTARCNVCRGFNLDHDDNQEEQEFEQEEDQEEELEENGQQQDQGNAPDQQDMNNDGHEAQQVRRDHDDPAININLSNYLYGSAGALIIFAYRFFRSRWMNE